MGENLNTLLHKETTLKVPHNYRLRWMILFFIGILCFTTASNILDFHQPERQEILREIFLEGISMDRLSALLSFQLLQDALAVALWNTMLLFIILWLAGRELKPLAKINHVFLNCREGTFLLVMFSLSLLYSATLAYFKHGGFPMSGDEYAYLTQAKIMAQGKLYVASHPLRQFFHCDYIVNNGKYFACYPLGTSFFLLFGELTGLPWLANPLVGSLALIVIFYLIKLLFTPEAARYGVYFILLGNNFSGANTPMNTTYLSHPASLLYISLFIYLFLTGLSRQQTYRLFLAGLALGGAIFTRPLTAAVIAASITIWGLYTLIRDKKPYRLVFVFILGLMLPMSLLMWANKIQTGNPFVLGYQLQFKSPGFQEGYNLIQAIGTMLWRLRVIEYMVKFAPLSIFIPLFFVMFAFKGENKYPYLFLGLLAMLCLAYLPLSTSIWDLRYYYPPLIYLIGLIPWGVSNFSHYSLKRGWRINYQHALSLLLLVILSFKLWGLYQGGLTPPPVFEKLKQPYNTIKQAGITNAVVFIREVQVFYPQWYTRNSLDYSDDVLYALDLGEENKLLMDYYPGWRYYIYDKGKLTRIYREGE
jgi:hypothetical protein